MSTDFKIIRDEEALKKMGITMPQWRQSYVYSIIGSPYSCGGGTMEITFIGGETQKVKCKNFNKRLSYIIYQLMMPRHKKCDCRWIEKIKAAYGVFEIADIYKLKVQVIEKVENC